MKKITISDLEGFTDICECERMLGELKAGCAIKTGEPVRDPNRPGDPPPEIPRPEIPIPSKPEGPSNNK